MKVLSPERMARYDRHAIETWGIPSAVLMENAGRNMYRLMKEQHLSGAKRLAIFCGRGNNGGDGFVIARYALLEGFQTKVFLLCRIVDLKGDGALNMNLYRSLGGKIIEVAGGQSSLTRWIRHADVIVDAIFGTGLSKPVGGDEALVIEEINRSGKPVIAVDIPSGIDGNTGVPMGVAIKASHTYTFAYPKVGQLLYPGAYHTGRLTVIDISIPPFIEEEIGYDGHFVDGAMIRGFLRDRLPWSHKGSYGHAAVIAGSPGKTGAAHMASLAALRIGAGLVTLLIPENLNHIMEVKTTEVMTYPIPDSGTGFFTLQAYEEIMEFIADKDVIIVGPGLSRNKETAELVRRLFTGTDIPFVIDADGINAFEGCTDLLGKAGGKAVLTPHPGEMGRLLNISPGEINADRIGMGRKLTAKTGLNLVLKGARTIFFDREGDVYINPTGNPSLAKGGSGDVLTGFIGGLISQGYTIKESSIIAVYLHGYLADDWAETRFPMDLLACDLLSGIGEVLRKLRDGNERIYIEKSL